MMNTSYQTTINFMTDSVKKRIDLALLSRFENAEWLEVRYKSTFQSDSLFRAIVMHYFDNAEQLLLSTSEHLFDVMYDNEVNLYFISNVSPLLKPLPQDHELSVDIHTRPRE